MKRFSFILVATFTAWLLLATAGVLAQDSHEDHQPAAPHATTWYVDAAIGDDDSDCLTPTTACATVGGAAGKVSNGDEILIAAGVYEEDLDLSSTLTMTGAGPESTFLDGANSHRILQTAGIADLTIAALTLRNGRVTGPSDRGGAIYNLGTLLLHNVTVMSNTAETGGGGIFNSGMLRVRDSRILSNTSEGAGGGFYGWNQGTFTVTDSLIAANTASQGGGIFSSSPFSLEDVTVRDNNSAIFGGGMVIFAGPTTLNGVSIYDNETDGYGAGILVNAGVVTVTNTTISGNTGDSWSGVANISSSAQTAILNSTVAHNVDSGAGVDYGGIGNINDAIITLQNTIVANNDGRNCVNSGDWTSLGHNVSSDGYCEFDAAGDLQFTDPHLAPLADYGGPTLTHALQPGSVAIDGGDDNACPATDQRGVPRPVDGDNDGMAVCDIGAFEAGNQLVVSDASVTEGNSGPTNTVFTVTVAPTSTQTIMVDYSTSEGTATAGSDYTTVSDTLVFSPGQATGLITVTVIGDTDDEPDETFTVNLSGASNADILDGQGEATIVDDDGLSSLTIADAAADEGDSGSTTAAFVVTLSPAAAQTVSVDYTTVDGSAAAGSDYTEVSGTLTFDPGETSHVVNVDVAGDGIDEQMSENFFVELSNATNANLTDSQAEGTIVDDDTARVSLQPGPSVSEGDTGTVPAVFSVTLSAPTAFPVTVDYATTSGTGGNFATPGVDFEMISGTLAFDPGETTQTVTVTVNGDLEVEEDELFNISLSNADPITIYGSASLGHILDDDSTDSNNVYLPFVVR